MSHFGPYVDFLRSPLSKQHKFFMSASIKIELLPGHGQAGRLTKPPNVLCLQIMYVFWHAEPTPLGQQRLQGNRFCAKGSQRHTLWRCPSYSSCLQYVSPKGSCAKLKCATFACLINEMFDNVGSFRLSAANAASPCQFRIYMYIIYIFYFCFVGWAFSLPWSCAQLLRLPFVPGVCGRSALMECSLKMPTLARTCYICVCVYVWVVMGPLHYWNRHNFTFKQRRRQCNMCRPQPRIALSDNSLWARATHSGCKRAKRIKIPE